MVRGVPFFLSRYSICKRQRQTESSKRIHFDAVNIRYFCWLSIESEKESVGSSSSSSNSLPFTVSFLSYSPSLFLTFNFKCLCAHGTPLATRFSEYVCVCVSRWCSVLSERNTSVFMIEKQFLLCYCCM